MWPFKIYVVLRICYVGQVTMNRDFDVKRKVWVYLGLGVYIDF